MSRTESPLFQMHFSFGPHANDSIHSLSRVHHQMLGFFSRNSEDRNILLIEASDMGTPTSIQIKKDTQKYNSLLTAYRLMFLPRSLGRPLREIANPAIVRNELAKVPPTDFSEVLFWRVDTILSSGINIIPEFENYSGSDFVTLERLQREIDLVKVELDAKMVSGDVNSAIELHKRSVLNFASNSRIRNQRLVGLLSEFLQNAIKKGEDTRVFSRLGNGHNILVDMISKSKFRQLREAPIFTEYDPRENGGYSFDIFDALVRETILDPHYKVSRENHVLSILEYLLGRHPIFQKCAGGLIPLKNIIRSTSLEEGEELLKNLTPDHLDPLINFIIHKKSKS